MCMCMFAGIVIVYVSESLSAQCTLVTSSASMLTLFQVSYALSILFLLLACV